MRRPSIAVSVLAVLAVAFAMSAPVGIAQGRVGRDTEVVNGHEASAREVIVKFRDVPGAARMNEIRGLADADRVETVGHLGARRIRSRSMSAAALVQLLASRDDVEYAEPNYILHAFTEPNDPDFSSLWGLENTGQAVNGGLPGQPGADIQATKAWDLSFGSTAHVVAVVDTGIDYTHPDLAQNMWSAPSAFTVTIAGNPITCPAGTHGFNAITLTCDPMDDNNHGTHVSGTIGATGQNGIGVVGVNWTTQLMGVKFLDSTGSGSEADAVNAIEFAIQAKQIFAPTASADVRVLSASWGETDFSQALLDEINAANDADMLFVAAAGNNGISNDLLPTYPASYDAPNIIAVAATTNTDARAWFSNYSPSLVHLGAPGVDIFSTTIGNTYAFLSGTSMATPHVSGAAMLVLSRCTLDTPALKQTLLSTVDPVAGLAGLTVTGGRLNVYSALRSCVEPPDAPLNLAATAGDTAVTLTWSGAAGATSFNVKRSQTQGGPYTPVATQVAGKSYVDHTVSNGVTYYYVVSGVNALGESVDSNEAFATPKAPSDLLVPAFTVPSTGGAGAPLVVTDTTANQGTGAAGPTTTRFYLTRYGAIDANAVILGQRAVPALAPGASSTATVTVTIPATVTNGTYFVVAKADADNTEAESSETNNTIARVVSVGADLVVSAFTVPSTAAPGATIVVSDTVKNQGGGAAGASTTRFYLSANAILDGSDILLAGSRSVPALAAGAVSAGSTSVVLPTPLTAGAYYLFAKADADSAVAEAWETNNTAARLVQIGGDLVVSSFTVPAAAGAGTTIVVSDTTSNTGSGDVDASVTRFYLSTNSGLDGSDLLLSGAHNVPALSAGSASSASTNVTIPAGLATGSYYLFAKADADNTVVETQELNNTTVRLIQIGGNLVVSSLTVPSKAAAGSTILISDTTTNRGAGSVSASTTRFYLSTDAVLQNSDTLLPGGRSVPDLAPGVSSSGSTMVAIPSTLAPGTYFLFAKADADNAVAETQEIDNTLARIIQITAAP